MIVCGHALWNQDKNDEDEMRANTPAVIHVNPPFRDLRFADLWADRLTGEGMSGEEGGGPAPSFCYSR
jgi:hypothetical protein